MKNAFYFTSKALFILKIFKFLSWLYGQVIKQLEMIRKIRLILSFMMSPLGYQTINTHIVQYLEKFGQSIKYNIRNIF